MSSSISIRQRVIKYLNAKRISKYRFYKDTGFSNGFLDKYGAIASDNCEKICQIYSDLNPEWLLTGRGDMQRTDRVMLTESQLKHKTKDVIIQMFIDLSLKNEALEQENLILSTRLAVYESDGIAADSDVE